MTDELFRVYVHDLDDFGVDGYPTKWHSTIKHVVRSLAGHRCVRCGHPYRSGEHSPGGEWSPCDRFCTHGGPTMEHADGETLMAQWRILTVHHLDGDKANCRWWNLVALDQRCHLTVQGKVKMQRAYERPHTPWFKPYAAGFYASKYLNEDLSRHETLERLDELLGLELRQDRLFDQALPTSVGERRSHD